ncbi:hypothetical protein [Dysgonomonas sp. 25]|uniref:hypothetical protein n=1 Tax=Dysgonomonas sp. 25 TaxID=2302933 RepID=UPI0013D5EB8A|nr:hypothetical protein [Dysgonomonas sp. 25]
MKTNELDKFGEFLVENLRDTGVEFAELLLKNHWKTPSLQSIQGKLSEFTEEQKNIVLEVTIKSIDRAIHDFLFAVQEEADSDNEIQIIVNKKNIAKISDGLHGEAYSEDGWYAKYSNYAEK